MLYYTGVGSRDITVRERLDMISIGEHLAYARFKLRSGEAPGSDDAFTTGAEIASRNGAGSMRRLTELFVPWVGFSKTGRPVIIPDIDCSLGAVAAARDYVNRTHPAPHRLSQGAWRLHSRNPFQVLGRGLDDPSAFLIACADYDRFGIPRGGTRTAWLCARHYGVPCFNLREIGYEAVLSSIESVVYERRD